LPRTDDNDDDDADDDDDDDDVAVLLTSSCRCLADIFDEADTFAVADAATLARLIVGAVFGAVEEAGMEMLIRGAGFEEEAEEVGPEDERGLDSVAIALEDNDDDADDDDEADAERAGDFFKVELSSLVPVFWLLLLLRLLLRRLLRVS
jgi:hypothetical protein